MEYGKQSKRVVQRFILSGLVLVTCALIGPSKNYSRANAQGPGNKPGIPIALGCSIASWRPVVLSFYGDPNGVLEQLDRYDMKLPERRIYLFVSESAESAELSLFEEVGAKHGEEKKAEVRKFNVWNWKGTSLDEFQDSEAKTILTTRGMDCVGKVTKELVMGLHPKQVGKDIDAPGNAREAFGELIKRFPDKTYIRTTVYLLC